jgi:hypothetical protein
MVRIDIRPATWRSVSWPLIRRKGPAGCCALGAVAAFMMTTPPAMADPTAPPPSPQYEIATQAVPGEVAPPEGVPHLSSPENLPPGTTNDPVVAPRSRGLSYLQDLWHAVQTQEVSMSDALLLLTQRPMDPHAAPPPGVAAGPQQPPPAPPPTP